MLHLTSEFTELCKQEHWKNTKHCTDGHEVGKIEREKINTSENNIDSVKKNKDNNIRDRLKKLQELLKAGLISKEEAANKRKELLNDL